MTLSLAIRMAQILGLHVVDEDRQTRSSPACSELEKELRRRTFYSAYNFDCLLSLQLGRPRCIKLSDNAVNLPAPQDFSLFDYKNDTLLQMPPGPHPGYLFKETIRFSHIVGQVIDDLYAPQQTRTAHLGATAIELLDRKLINWRNELPRHLRFDLGHAFEKNSLFEQQRNVLALKFHHLRALVHRPHLCLEWLSKDNARIAGTTERVQLQIAASGRLCISAAQATARMLHNVSDKHSLIETFPW